MDNKISYLNTIKQAAHFTVEQRRQIAYYFLYPTLQEENKKKFDQLFDIKIDINPLNEMIDNNHSNEYSKKHGIKLGLLKGKIQVPDDFDEPLNDLMKDIY